MDNEQWEYAPAVARGAIFSLFLGALKYGQIPSDPEALTRLCNLDPGELEHVLPFLKPYIKRGGRGRWRFPLAEAAREDAVQRYEARRAGNAAQSTTRSARCLENKHNQSSLSERSETAERGTNREENKRSRSERSTEEKRCRGVLPDESERPAEAAAHASSPVGEMALSQDVRVRPEKTSETESEGHRLSAGRDRFPRELEARSDAAMLQTLWRSLVRISHRARFLEVVTVWDAYLGEFPRARVLDKRSCEKILACLEVGLSVEELADVPRGARRSSFHMGENAQGVLYTGLTTLFKDASTAQQHIQRARAPLPCGVTGHAVRYQPRTETDDERDGLIGRRAPPTYEAYVAQCKEIGDEPFQRDQWEEWIRSNAVRPAGG